MKITRIIIAILLSTGFLWAEHDRDIGRLYLNEAAFLFEAGDYSESEKLINTARQFIYRDSDMLYLLGRLGFQKRDSLSKCGLYFNEALIVDDWTIYSPADLAENYIPILFQTKNYSKSLTLLSDPDFNPRPSDSFIWMHGRALKEAGRMADAVDTVKEGLAFYPDSRILYDLLFELAPGEQGRYADLLLNGTVNHPDLVEIILPLIIPEVEDNVSELFDIYDERDFFNLESEIKRIKQFGLENVALITELADKGVFNDGDLLRELLMALPFNNQRRIVETLFNSWTGELREDLNDDGWSEIIVDFSDGKISSLKWDPDQDGKKELTGEYENGILRTLTLTGNSDIFIEYELYPWVRRITRRDEERILVYNLALGQFAIDFPEVSPFESVPSFEIPEPDWGYVQTNSRNVLIYSPGDDSPLEEYIPLFNRGGITSTFPKGGDEFRRRFYVRNGSVEFIEQDLTGDPGWDTISYYQDGFLKLIAHDAREDGIYEYAETPGRTEGRSSLSVFRDDDGWFFWDFNQNGSYDCRERRVDTRILREYSSKDDGNYDILIEIEALK
ncbi:MAG: tetratricopeptide repeat protein [Spirochaetales bacterium]|nr:tetratricopeptide repeat protein [Spirochaetales bacterium]